MIQRSVTVSGGTRPRADGALPSVNSSTFERVVLRAKLPVVVEFMSHACPPCVRLEPVVREVAAQLAGRALFVQVDARASQDLVRAHGVTHTPTFVIFNRGAEVTRGSTGPDVDTLRGVLLDVLTRIEPA